MHTASLPAGIEIFRPGRHIDDAGRTHEFSEQDIRDIATGYDPAVREAPLCVGHPSSNLPAYGWVAGLQVNADGRLAMDTRAVEPQFAEMVADRRFPKRSASFYPPNAPNNPTPGKWYLRHVAFLGAQPPAIAGLKDIEFADDASGAVSFSEGDLHHSQEQSQMDKDLQAAQERAAKAEAEAKAARDAQAKAEAARAEADKQLAQFAEQQRSERHASFVGFAEAQVKAGRLLPKDQATTVAVLDAVADAQPVEFSEGDATRKVSPVEFIKGLIESATPAVSFGEFAPGNAGSQGGKGLSDAEIDAKAKAYAKEKNVSYSEALSAICSFTA
jgi:hypothetical protein